MIKPKMWKMIKIKMGRMLSSSNLATILLAEESKVERWMTLKMWRKLSTMKRVRWKVKMMWRVILIKKKKRRIMKRWK